jgi:hypothetical protein
MTFTLQSGKLSKLGLCDWISGSGDRLFNSVFCGLRLNTDLFGFGISLDFGSRINGSDGFGDRVSAGRASHARNCEL